MNKKIFYSIVFICLFASGVLIYGMASVFQYAPVSGEKTTGGQNQGMGQTDIVNNGQPVEPQREASAPEDQYTIIILGDSIARGRGDDNSSGLVRAFPERVNQRALEIINAGIDGLVSSELPEILDNQELLLRIKDADLVIISIGGNDLRRLAFRAFQGEEVSPSSMVYRDIKQEYTDNLNTVIQKIRENNTTTSIMTIGLFNPFEAEDINGFIPRDVQIDLLFDWNNQTMKTIEQDRLALFVPTYDLFKWNDQEFLSFDFIHPSEDGYQAISERLLAILRIEG